MSIIFLGGNYSQFANTSGGVSTNTSAFNTAFAKYALFARSDNTTAASLLSTASEWWFHCVYYNIDTNNSGVALINFTIGGNYGYSLYTTTATTVRMAVWTGGAWSTVSANYATLAEGPKYTIDLFFKPHASNGTAKMYIDGVLISEDTGIALMADDGATIDGVIVRGNYPTISGGAYYSEMVMTDAEAESTIGWHVSTILPTAAGATSGWTGAYTDIDEAVLNTDDYISTDTDATVSTFAFGNLDASVASDLVVGVYVSTVLAKTVGASVSSIDLVVRPSSTNYFPDNSGALAEGPVTNYKTSLLVNPETGVAWTVAGVEGCEFGFRANT